MDSSTSPPTTPPQVPPKIQRRPTHPDMTSSVDHNTKDAFGDDVLPISNQHKILVPTRSVDSAEKPVLASENLSFDDIMHNLTDSIAELERATSRADPLARPHSPEQSPVMTSSLTFLPSEMSNIPHAPPRPTPRPRASTRKKTPPSPVAAVAAADGTGSASPKPVPRARTHLNRAATDNHKAMTSEGVSQNNVEVNRVQENVEPCQMSSPLTNVGGVSRSSESSQPQHQAVTEPLSTMNSKLPTLPEEGAVDDADISGAIYSNISELSQPIKSASSEIGQTVHTPSTYSDASSPIYSNSLGLNPTPSNNASRISQSALLSPVYSNTSNIGQELESPQIPSKSMKKLPALENNASNLGQHHESAPIYGNISESNQPIQSSNIHSTSSAQSLSSTLEQGQSPTSGVYGNTSKLGQLPTSGVYGNTSELGQPTSPSAIYGNTSELGQPIQSLTGQSSDMQGIPIPPSTSEAPLSCGLTPLSDESLTILDPTEYMSLWELQSSMIGLSLEVKAPEVDTPTATNSSSLIQSLSGINQKRVGPPIPPRLSETTPVESGTAFPFLSGTFSKPMNSTGDDLDNDRTLEFRYKPSLANDEFRNSYLLPLPMDPFADDEADIFSLDKPAPTAVAKGLASPEASALSPSGDVSKKKLLPRRAAPLIPTNKSAIASTSPNNVDLYTAISKTKSTAAPAKEESSPYCLADDVGVWFDNPAASYDSEDTVDEDSDPDYSDQPDLPPKILPVTASPRTAQTDRHGYLYKQGGKLNNKGWRKRYVTFDGLRLRYFSSDKSRISKRIIPVEVMKQVENDVKDFDSGKFRFRVVTLNRVYLFAAETLEDHHFWTNILMQAIILFKKKNCRGSIGQGMMRGGVMHTPEIESFVRLDDNKKYIVIKDGKLCYYNNDNDYQFATPIHEVGLDTASVKDIGKNKLQLTTPYHRYILSHDTDADLERWKIALEDGIAAALSDDSVLNEVYQNPSNRMCADCSNVKPHWAVLHLSTVVCSHCAGIHRQFWPFKVKSIRMDTKVWTQPLIDLYIYQGNKTINSVWEAHLTSGTDKIAYNATSPQRRTYILKKYSRKAFFPSSVNQLSAQPTTEQLSQELNKSIKQGQMADVVFLINKGTDQSPPLSLSSALNLAESTNHSHIAQYLKQNGAENETSSDIWAVIREQHTEAPPQEKQIIKSGHLYRMHSIKKDYPRQWVVLTARSIKFYDEETDHEARFAISCRSVINFCRHDNDKNEPSFEMTCNGGANTYMYGADDWDTIYTWMSSIHKAFTASAEHTDLGIDFDKAGHVHCKKGSLGGWKLCWLQLKKKRLHILDPDGSCTEDVDLRKVLKLSLTAPDETTAPGPGEEGGSLLVLYMSDHYTYIQSDLKHETERWHNVIDSSLKEISHNLEEQQLNKDNVPVLIERCIEFISLHGMTTEGIYRLSGTHSKVTCLLNDFINGARSVHIKLEDYTVHDVANVLKRYLRNLQEPVMSSLLYGKWLSAAMLTKPSSETSTDRTAHDEKLYTYKELLEELPAVNLCTLKMIIGHLNRVAANEAENKMGQANLATLFGPVLLSGSSTESSNQQQYMNTSFEIQLVIDLMNYYQWLFSVDESELKKESEIQAKIEEMKKFNPLSAAPSGEFILGIYIYNNLGEPINMKVAAQKTAADIVSDVVGSKRIPRADGYSLFEVVCSGELERALAEDEKVLDATLAISTLNPEHSKGSYLCVKEDIHRESIEQTMGPDISRFTELSFSDKKGWRKMYFELSASQLICYKDKVKISDQWNLCELAIYMGVEKKRKPPTAFGVTFLCSAEGSAKLKESTHLGRSICFNSGDEMYTWLSSIYYGQSQYRSPPSTNIGGSMKMSLSTSALADKKAASPKFRLPSLKKPFRRHN